MALSAVFSRTKALVAGLLLLIIIASAGPVMAEEPQIDWKTLPEYMAMDRVAQQELILKTRRIVMRKLAETDYDRADCVAGLFDVTEEGNKQFYNLKGLLKAAAEKGSGWKAQQIVAHMITKEFCPALSEKLGQ